MVTWHPLLEWWRAHSRRMENLISSPPRVKNGEFSEKISPQASCFSPGEARNSAWFFTAGFPFLTREGNSAWFSEKATKGCHTFLYGEAILLAPLFPHSPVSENPFSDLREGVTTPSIIVAASHAVSGSIFRHNRSSSYYFQVQPSDRGDFWAQGRDTYSWHYKGIGYLGVQRPWSEIMNVLANPKGSVGRWNLNFWRLEQFYTNFWSKGVVDTYSKS
jgi:hypothetical protein